MADSASERNKKNANLRVHNGKLVHKDEIPKTKRQRALAKIRSTKTTGTTKTK